MIIQYLDKDIADILSSKYTFMFNETVLSKIKSIVSEVGAPEYTHTPQFYKKDRGKHNVSDKDWELIRNFKTTQIKKREGIDASVDIIRKYLNKMSVNTYEKLKDKIIDEIKIICKNNNLDKMNDADMETGGLIKLGDVIFSIASSSIFYSKMYAKLYSDLIGEFNFMKIIFNKNFNDFSKVFNDITSCDPNDYDKYCENNKKNEKRRALGLFYVNLMIEKIVSNDEILNIIIGIQTYLESQLDIEGGAEIVDELVEVLSIMIVACKNQCNCELWRTIMATTNKISKLNLTDKLSITNKTIFKHMDIIDAIQYK